MEVKKNLAEKFNFTFMNTNTLNKDEFDRSPNIIYPLEFEIKGTTDIFISNMTTLGNLQRSSVTRVMIRFSRYP